MRFIAATLVMLLHLSQINPALPCTFKQLPPSAVIKVPYYHGTSRFLKHSIEECMKMCFEDPSCVYVVSLENGICSSDPSEGNTYQVDSLKSVFGHRAVVYQLYRNVTATECPTLKEWLQRGR